MRVRPNESIARGPKAAYKGGMRPRPEEIQRVAHAVVRGLVALPYVQGKGDQVTMVRRVIAAIEASYDQEMEIEREAEKLAAIHAGKMDGLDQRRVIQGIKARLAEERNFPL